LIGAQTGQDLLIKPENKGNRKTRETTQKADLHLLIRAACSKVSERGKNAICHYTYEF